MHASCQDKTEIYDAVYVINLDRSPDRLKKISKQLNDIGIKFRKFKAIDGNKLKIVNVKTGQTEDPKTFTIKKKFENNDEYIVSTESCSAKYKTDKKICNRYLCYGEIGCAMSHLGIMHDIVKNNFRKTIILEDDIIFEKNFKDDLKLTLINTPDNFDILFLDVGMNAYYVDLDLPVNERVYIANPARLLRNFAQISDNKYLATISETNNLWGTHAYCVSLGGAKKIISSYNPIIEPIDEHLFHNPEINNSRTKRYVARKKMLYISDEPSLICTMGRNGAATQNTFYSKK